MFEATETSDFDRLQKMFFENGLEVSERTSECVVKCWEIRADKDGDTSAVAALRLEKRKGEFVIVGICVGREYRKSGLGTLLLDKAVCEVRRLGGKRLLVVTKAPGFFEGAGFIQTDAADFEGIISCLGCEQINSKCFPVFMSLSL